MINLVQSINEVTVGNITVLTIAGAALTFLIRYLIASKDKNTEVIMKDIKEMKDMFYRLSNDNNILNNNFGYSKSNLETLTKDVKTINDRQFDQSRKIEQLISFKTQTEREISDLKKLINELKRKQ